MKATRSFRKSRKSNRSRKGGRVGPRGVGSRRSVSMSQQMHSYSHTPSHESGSFTNTLVFIFIVFAIFAKMNEINEPFKPFSPSVHFWANPLTSIGLHQIPKRLPGPDALKNVNLMKSPAFLAISNRPIGNTPLKFAKAMGIPSKYTSRKNFLPSAMHYMYVFQQLDIGPTTTIKELIKKIVEKADGDKKEEIKQALLDADLRGNEVDIMSRIKHRPWD